MRQQVSFYFYAGDFHDVMKRAESGEPQLYGTHDQVAKVVNTLADDGWNVRIFSFRNDQTVETSPRDNVFTIKLASKSYRDDKILQECIDSDKSDVLIPHFPNLKLLGGAVDKGRPVLLGMANTYNRKGPRSQWLRFRTVKALNDSRLSLVANHCWPSTSLLEKSGVKSDRLIPWDIPKAFSPKDFSAKQLSSSGEKVIAYVGAVTEEKGVGDLLEAVSLMQSDGLNVTAKIAGAGQLEKMKQLAAKLGIEDHVIFLGLIPHDEVFGLFRSSDLAVVPSRHSFPEGLPLTFFEAVASRTPVICSDHPVLAPIMHSIDGTAVFRQRRADSLARRVKEVLLDPERYANLSQSADDIWDRLSVSADWATLMLEFVNYGPNSEWISKRKWPKLKDRVQASA